MAGPNDEKVDDEKGNIKITVTEPTVEEKSYDSFTYYSNPPLLQ